MSNQDVENIQVVLDAAIKAGVIGNLQSAGSIAISWENIKTALKEFEQQKQLTKKEEPMP